MKKFNKKFIFTKALYIMIWVAFVATCLMIISRLYISLRDEDWHPIGLLYEGVAWDVIQFFVLLFLGLSFKEEPTS